MAMKIGNFKGKKGTIELSLNLIIMLIIGMVVLGLVIGFVHSLVNQGTQKFKEQLTAEQQEELNQVKDKPGNLALLPETSINLKKDGKSHVYIKVRAYGSEGITIDPGDLDNGKQNVLTYKLYNNDGPIESGDSSSSPLSLTCPGFDASQGSEDAEMCTLKTGESAVVGKTYYIELILYPGNSQTSKRITVNVD